MKRVFNVECSVCSLLAGSLVMAAEPLPLSSGYWKDPAFQKAFNGSYRIEARIEPAVTSEERGLLVEIQTLMEQGQRKEALAKLKASPLTAKSTALRFNLGNLHFEEGELDEAIAAYQKAVTEYPSFRRALRNLAVAHVRKGEMDQALGPLLEAIRLGDSEGATYGLLGYCRLQRGEWASALQAYRLAQVSEPDTADWKAGVAQCLQHLNARDEAVALLDEVIRQRPLEASYAVLQSSILLDLGRTTEAVKSLELPRRMGTLDADALLLLADLHLRENRIEPAKQAIAEAFAKPAMPATGRIVALVSSAIRQRDWPLANEVIAKAATDGTTAASRAFRLVSAQLGIESGASPQESADRLAKLVQEDPTDGAALLILGKFRAKSGAAGEAETLFERATTDATVAAEAWLELARLHVDARRYPEALKAVDQALALNPAENLRTYRESLAQLAQAAE